MKKGISVLRNKIEEKEMAEENEEWKGNLEKMLNGE